MAELDPARRFTPAEAEALPARWDSNRADKADVLEAETLAMDWAYIHTDRLEK